MYYYGVDGVGASTDLGSRLARLLAALVDGALAMAFPLLAVMGVVRWAPGVFLRGAVAGKPQLPASLPTGLVAVLIFGALAATLLFTLYQWYGLAVHGQTLGKRLLGLQIVDGQGRPAGFVRALLLRTWVFGFLMGLANGLLGAAGGLLPIVNLLPIFFSDRRCVHDYVAGTWVRVASDSPVRALVPLGFFGAAAAGLVAIVAAQGVHVPVDEFREALASQGVALRKGVPAELVKQADGIARPPPAAAGPKDDVVIRGPKATAALYRWVDDKGTVNFAEDLSSVPARYRPRAELLR